MPEALKSDTMRTYKRKTERADTPKDVVERACHLIIFDNKSIKATSKQYDIPYKTLHRYVAKLKEKFERNPNLTRAELTLDSVGYIKNRQVFTDVAEEALASYFKKAADIYYGLTPYETRKLAYQFAIKSNKAMPDSWRTKLLAGEDWLGSFLKRHPSLSIRTPQATSLSRATSFNVSMFFANLTTVYQRLNLSPGDIWNVDETGITTVQVPNRIIARRVGCEGDANPSGWIREENFIKYAKHFVQHVKPSKEKPVLLLLDNHDSHLSIEALDYFKANGVTVLSFPPHCSHKLQPLDRSVYGPLKKYFNRACDNWLASNPENTITIYDIPELLKTLLPLAATIENIQSGFRVSGISPLNENIFPDSEFSGSYVTDRPMPNSHAAGNSSACDVSTVAVPSISDASNRLSNVEEVPIPDHHTVTETHTLAPQCSFVNTDQITNTMPSLTRSLSTKCESPSLLDETLNSVYEAELTENLKTPENVHLPEANVPPSLYNLNLASTSSATLEELRPFPKAAPLLDNRRNIRKRKNDESTICLECTESYADGVPGEQWIQCITCKLWAHSKCARGNLMFFECKHCISDIED
ncbi:hypothetical protein ILUMI_03748 [Ignelater luminosus]|uniref:DDE-1 domain-containing protein n=1 Tax=Ignelater luminosus TaxID=2038154 RepID=A0A8K0DFN7_IGNLU|nr:hypothetical protein ILUMI_03748 [Ignelater luminosus]